MRTEIYWVDTPTSGRLAIMPRPRGGDWLEDEVKAWRATGIDVVVSLLTADEVADLDLANEESICNANGIQCLSFPIVDRGVPVSREATFTLLAKLMTLLAEGKKVAIHCRQGIGRAPLIAIGVLMLAGLDRQIAKQRVSAARGVLVPETVQQDHWIAALTEDLVAAAQK